VIGSEERLNMTCFSVSSETLNLNLINQLNTCVFCFCLHRPHASDHQHLVT